MQDTSFEDLSRLVVHLNGGEAQTDQIHVLTVVHHRAMADYSPNDWAVAPNV